MIRIFYLQISKLSARFLMGNKQSNDSQFSKKDWVQIGSNSNNVTLWQNTSNRHIHMEQYRIYTTDSDELHHEHQLFYHRKNHPRWVAAYFFHEQNNDQFCVTRSIAHVFVQKIPLRICDLKDLPLPDLIHCFDQCFAGYKQLAKLIGNFRVYSEYIGINERGIVKVWAGPYWSQIGVIGNRLSQEEMVWSIVQCLSNCLESPSQNNSFFSIKNFLYRNTDKLTFDQANYQLHALAGTYNNNIIPNRLQSLYDSNNFDMFLDPLLKSNHDLQNSHRIESHEPLEARFMPRINGVSPREEQNRDFGPTFRKVDNPVQIYNANNLAARQPEIVSSTPFQQGYLPFQVKKINSREETGGKLEIGQRFNNNYNKNLTLNLNEPKLISSTYYATRQVKETKETSPKLASSVKFQFSSPPTQQIYQTNSNYQSPLQINPNNYQNHNSFKQLNTVQGFNAQQKTLDRPTFTIPPPRQTQINTTQNQTIPQSIIMKLYNSDEAMSQNEEPLKKFGKVKRTESRVDEPMKRFDSFSIKADQPIINNNGVTNNQMMSPFNRLQSIQEVNSEHWRNDTNSFNSPPIRQPSNSTNSQPQASNSQNFKYQFQQNSYNYNNRFDPNDGKTSESLLNQLRQINTNQRNSSQSHYSQFNYNSQHPYQQNQRGNQYLPKNYTLNGNNDFQKSNQTGFQRFYN